jgi:hypothetical protein
LPEEYYRSALHLDYNRSVNHHATRN